MLVRAWTLIALFLLAVPTVAAAQTTNYNVSGTFNNGIGTYTGTVTYNGAVVTAASITTSAGTVWAFGGNGAFPANSAIAGTTYSSVLGGGNSSSTVTVLAGPAGLNQRGFSFVFDPVLGTVNPDTIEGREFSCNTADCGTRVGLRVAAGAAANDVVVVAPVPTMSEWAMILLGLMLAGGAAVYIQRRQMMA